MPVARWVAFAATALIASSVAACGHQHSADMIALLPQRTVTSVEVRLSPKLDVGMFPSLDGVSHEQKAATVAGQVKQSISSRLGSLPQGRAPTKLVVTITKVDFASDVGRVLGSRAYMGGEGRLVDAKTGADLGSLGVVHTHDVAPMTGSGYGAVLALAVNAAQTANSSALQLISDEFADEVLKRLKS